MKSSVQWLDAAKTVLRIDSDRGLDTHFGWKQQSAYDIRRGKRFLNNTEAANIADTLKVNPLVIIADAETERAKDETQRLYWANAAKKFAGLAASVLTAATLWTLEPSPAYSMTMEQGDNQFILCKIISILIYQYIFAKSWFQPATLTSG